MKTFFTLIFLFFILTSSADERPNIIIILTDDMGYSDLGCFGGEIDTPNLDGLAAKGLRFTDFYNTARCWPTRATLMTGSYQDKLMEKVTIADCLRNAGYQTGIVGKWHLGKDPKKDGPLQYGFDDFYGTMTGAGSFYDPMTLARKTEFTEPDSKDYYYTDKIGSEAVRQIRQFAKTDKPFFQYVAFTAAHWPIQAPEKSIQKYKDHYVDGWEKLRDKRYEKLLELGIIDKETWPRPPKEKRVRSWEKAEHKEWHIRNMAIYAAMVDHMDQAVGKIVDALKETKKLDNTFIIYFHDNGACAEHLSGNGWNTANNVIEKAKKNGQKFTVGDDYNVPNGGPLTYGSIGRDWAWAQNAPLRRYKANVYNGGSNTPAIVHWPAGLKTKDGQITRQRGHVVDMMATCLELGKAEYPDKWKGKEMKHESRSLVPIFKGEKVNSSYPYYFNHSRTYALIKGKYKVVREWGGNWHLYNLELDRTETKNIATENPELLDEMVKLWEKRWGKKK